MTREEAITVLKAFMENPLFSDVHKAAFNIAIHDIKRLHDWDINNLILINIDNYKLLEQTPTTKNDLGVDCISRADVIDEVNRIGANVYKDYSDYSNLIDFIDELPSVTPQEPFINKPCVSSSVCEHDKNKILDKIRAKIDEQYDRVYPHNISCAEGLEMALGIIDKYKAESEDNNAEVN